MYAKCIADTDKKKKNNQPPAGSSIRNLHNWQLRCSPSLLISDMISRKLKRKKRKENWQPWCKNVTPCFSWLISGSQSRVPKRCHVTFVGIIMSESHFIGFYMNESIHPPQLRLSLWFYPLIFSHSNRSAMLALLWHCTI